MSVTPLDFLLQANTSQPGLLAPVSRVADARADDFEDHLRDANKVSKTEIEPSERESQLSDKALPTAKSASKRRTDDAKETAAEAHARDEQSSQSQETDTSEADQSRPEQKSDQADGAEGVVVAGAEKSANAGAEVVAVEAAAIDIDAFGESGERDASEEEPPADKVETTDKSNQVVESVLSLDNPAQGVEPGLNPPLADGQAESVVVADSTSITTEETEALPSEAVPGKATQTTVNTAGNESLSAAPVQPTDIETAATGETKREATPNNQQVKNEQVATMTSSQSDTSHTGTSPDQDQPRQDGSSKRSFGAPQHSGELNETITEKAEQPLSVAKSEVIKSAVDINTQADRSPADTITSTATPTENGRGDGLLGAFGKLQQSAGRAIQSTTETDQSNQPRVDSARFVGRVARAFQIAQDRGGTIQLRLSPPELGSLKLQVTIEQGILSATIEAETDAARNALLDNLPALRAKLAEQEIRIDKFDVNVGHEGDDSPQEFETHEREQRRNGPTRSALRRDNPQANDPTAALIDITEITTGDNNINLLI